MQNPSTSKPAKQLHDVSEAVKETIDQTIPEFRHKIKGIATETVGQISEAQHNARGWVQHNYGKTLGIVGAIAAIGTLGYLLGKNNFGQELWSPKQDT